MSVREVPSPARPLLAFSDRGAEKVDVWCRRVRAIVGRLAGTDPAGAHRPDPVTQEVDAGPDGEPRRSRIVLSGGITMTVLAPAAPISAVLICPDHRPSGERSPADAAEGLARAGFFTVTLDYRLPAAGVARAEIDAAHRLAGGSLLGALVEEAGAALRWLIGQPATGSRAGILGIGTGGAVALHTALTSVQAPPLCLVDHVGTYAAMCRQPGSGGLLALPGILRHADLPDLLAAAQPSALQLQYHGGGTDTPGTAGAVRAAYAAGERSHLFESIELAAPGMSVPDAVEFFHRAAKSPDLAGTLIPPVRIYLDVPSRRAILDSVDAALASGMLTLSREVERFEGLAAPWVGGPAVGLNAGTSALEIALSIAGVAGRTVLAPVNTFFATVATALRLGARVDFVDMELDGLGMDPESLRAALARNDDVAVVMVVHIGGVVAPSLRAVLRECESRGIPVIEDAAHAFGSRLDGEPAGTFGRMAAFSLYPTKVVTSAEGGILTGKSAEELDLARRLRDHGRTPYSATLHDCLGGNWRLSELHAAVGSAHLALFAGMHAERHRLAARYDEALAGIAGLRAYEPPAGVETNFYKYLVFLDDGVDRGELKSRLRRRHAIALPGEVYDTILCDQPYFTQRGFDTDRYPRARWFAQRHAALPLYPGLTESEQDRVAEALREELT